MTHHEKAREPKYQNHGNCINVISRRLHLELLNEQRYEQRDRDRERERENVIELISSTISTLRYLRRPISSKNIY